MKIGVVVPQTEIGADAGGVRAWAQGVEALGFAHALAYDHVLGADPEVHRGWTGPYTVHTTFHEPFVLFGYLAGITALELVTGIIILPQRQTALVAKQAAEVAVLSGGRLRLGVGLGWAEPEFAALGESFTDRGRRITEQIAVLRALFTQEVVTFSGRRHQLEGVGIAPLPARPVPIWIGGHADAALRRVAALGEGWMPMIGPQQVRRDGSIGRLHAYARAQGRDPASIGIDPILSLASGGPVPAGTAPLRPPQAWVEEVQAWQALGATHLSVNTMGAGFSLQQHLEAIQRFKGVVDAAVRR